MIVESPPATARSGRAPEAAPRLHSWRLFRVLGGSLLLLVLGAAAITILQHVRLQGAFVQMQDSREAQEQSRRVLGWAVDMESGHRGFLLSGDRRQLESYERASAELPPELARLRALLAQWPALLPLQDEVERLLRVRRGEMAAVLMLYETHGRAAALVATQADLGKPEMDSLRLGIEALEQALGTTTATARDEVRSLVGRRTATIGATLALVALLGVLSLFLGARHYEALRRHERLQGEVQRSRRESDEKSTFLAHVSHEIRTPMNAIFGFSGLLHDRLADPVDRRYIEAIMSSARALLGMINDLLDLSKIEAGKIEIRPAPASLRDVVGGVIALFSQQAADRRLDLHAEFDPALPPALLIDSDRLRQILVNLASNAIKFTRDGSVVIRVAARPMPDPAASGSGGASHPAQVELLLEVADTGIGISRRDLGRIFQPFAQARALQGGEGPGTGLGLAITRQLVMLMGGEIGADSQSGRGSLFRVRLPGIAVAPEATPFRPDGPRLSDLPPRRILVADDVEHNRDVLVEMLRNAGHLPLLASDGPEALALARSEHPDAVLLDIRMPGMSGFEVVRLLRADPASANLHVVAVTASRLSAESELGELFDGVVIKPVTQESLYRALERTAGGRVAAPAADATPVPGAPEDLEELVEELDGLLERQWPGLRDALTLREVGSFAARLEGLGSRHGVASLGQYAARLGAAAASFDVARVETLLAEYPARVAELRPAAAAEGAAHPA